MVNIQVGEGANVTKLVIHEDLLAARSHVFRRAFRWRQHQEPQERYAKEMDQWYEELHRRDEEKWRRAEEGLLVEEYWICPTDLNHHRLSR